jgi:hypothetical protein
MKLAEALISRADCQSRIETLKERLLLSARVQEGDSPPEDPMQLIDEMERVSSQLLHLIQRINATNSVTELDKGVTISDALAQRDVLARRWQVYKELAARATVTQDRYSKSEVRFQSTVKISEIQKKADDLARQYRGLDSRIQAANWLNDLQE